MGAILMRLFKDFFGGADKPEVQAPLFGSNEEAAEYYRKACQSILDREGKTMDDLMAYADNSYIHNETMESAYSLYRGSVASKKIHKLEQLRLSAETQKA